MESSRMFVRGLPPNMSPEDFKAHFSKQSPLTDIKLIPHRRIGYVGYKTPEDAAKAVKYHNKTYIRMSRIGAELARAVEEQRALRPGANATSTGVKRKYGEKMDDNVEEIMPQGKPKHEGGQSSEGKAKLQEFLEVMQPPSKSKIWESQVAPTVQVPMMSNLLSEKQNSVDVRSDDEYEPVSKKRKGERKDVKDELAGEAAKMGDVDHKNRESEPLIDQETEAVIDEAAATTQVASDADWLRSRTSRLLGLTDDDIALEPTVLPDVNESQKNEELNCGDMSDASTQIDVEDRNERPSTRAAQSQGTEDTNIDKTRLFVRNLTYTTTEDELRRHFETGNYGNIEEVRFQFLLCACHLPFFNDEHPDRDSLCLACDVTRKSILVDISDI